MALTEGKTLSTFNSVQLIELPRVSDIRGNLCFVETQRHVPFEIKRAYWIYDVPGGMTHGGRPSCESEELIVALSGSLDVVLHDGKQKHRYHLDRSHRGLLVPNGLWRGLENFSTDSLALILASTAYRVAAMDSASRSSTTPLVECQQNTVTACQLIRLPKTCDPAGAVASLNGSIDLPFEIKRIYYLSDIPSGQSRGGHAHKKLNQYLAAVSGRFDVKLFDGRHDRVVSLNCPDVALHIPPGIWRSLSNFSSGAICLALTSALYDENDYARSYREFLSMRKSS